MPTAVVRIMVETGFVQCSPPVIGHVVINYCVCIRFFCLQGIYTFASGIFSNMLFKKALFLLLFTAYIGFAEYLFARVGVNARVIYGR